MNKMVNLIKYLKKYISYYTIGTGSLIEYTIFQSTLSYLIHTVYIWVIFQFIPLRQ